MKTRREIEDAVSALGADACMAGFLASLDAGYRHEERTAMTREVGLAAATKLIAINGVTQPDGASAPVELTACALAAADRVGIGGTGDAEGLGTHRLPCFSKLGSGRKQAVDGPAWEAASVTAFGTDGLFTIVNGRLAFQQAGVVVVFSPTQNDVFPLRWQMAIVRRAAWVAARRDGLVRRDVPLDVSQIDHETPLAEWLAIHAVMLTALKEATTE